MILLILKNTIGIRAPLGNNTAIKLTTARYYTPNGRSIQAKGITPDIVVEEPGSESRAFLREADLDKHLANDKDKAVEVVKAKPAAQPSSKPKSENGEEPPKPIEFGSDKDFQLTQAVNKLKGLPLVLKN